MNKTLLAMLIVLSTVLFGATQLSKVIPSPIPTAVIAEKSNGTLGNQAAVLLPDNLNSYQSKVLNTAYEIAKADGHRHPEVLQGILLQETKAGGMKAYRVAGQELGSKERYYGLAQLKVSAARDVLGRYPGMWSQFNFHTRTDDEIIANLQLNDRFNITVASRYLLLLQTQYGLVGRDLINAYNRGPGGVKNVDRDFHYAVGVEQKLAEYKGR